MLEEVFAAIAYHIKQGCYKVPGVMARSNDRTCVLFCGVGYCMAGLRRLHPLM